MTVKELVAGLPASKIKRILKISLNDFINSYQVEKMFHMSRNDVLKVMDDLLALGYVSYLSEACVWTNTIKGDLFAHETLIQTISRDAGERIIKELIKRIKRANTDAGVLDWIDTAFIFGGFLDKEIKEYSNITVAISISMKEKSLEEYKSKAKNMYRDSPDCPSDDFSWRKYLKEKLLRDLKGKKHNLIVTESREPTNLNYPYEIIYKRI